MSKVVIGTVDLDQINNGWEEGEPGSVLIVDIMVDLASLTASNMPSMVVQSLIGWSTIPQTQQSQIVHLSFLENTGVFNSVVAGGSRQARLS